MSIRAGVGVGLLLVCPTVVQAQMTAYAVIPSWTQSKVLVNDAHTGKAVASITLTGEPYDVAVTPDGRWAYVTLRAQHRVAVIDLGTMQVLTKIHVGAVPRGVAITPDGTRAWITEAGSDTVTAIDIATNTAGTPLPVGQQPWGIAITPGGERAYVVNRTSSTVSAIDLATQTVIAVIPVDQEPVEIMIAPDGRTAYVTSTIANTVVPIDLKSHTVLPSIPVGLFPRDLVFTPDGKQIFVADSNSATVTVIDATTNVVIDTIPTGVGTIPSGATITPDGLHVLVSMQSGTTLILDAATHAILSTFPIGGQGLRLVSTPNLIVPSTKAAPLSIGSDVHFTKLGFDKFITFRGGRLRATNDWTTSRNVSLLTQGGILDTQAFGVELAGAIVNDGTLQKRGVGTLTLSGASTHPSTQAGEGTLVVTGTHAGSIAIGLSATLAGTGTVGDVDATQGGAISPGFKGPGELHAANVQMGPQHSLIIQLDGLTPGVDYDRLVVSGTAVLHDATLVLKPSVSFPQGSTFTIVTNAITTFAGLPEGAVIVTPFGNFSITYFGGPSLTDVVLTAL